MRGFLSEINWNFKKISLESPSVHRTKCLRLDTYSCNATESKMSRCFISAGGFRSVGWSLVSLLTKFSLLFLIKTSCTWVTSRWKVDGKLETNCRASAKMHVFDVKLAHALPNDITLEMKLITETLWEFYFMLKYRCKHSCPDITNEETHSSALEVLLLCCVFLCL